MHPKATTLTAYVLGPLLVSVSQVVSAANPRNWEGPQNVPSADNRAVNWWYASIAGKTLAKNGKPPSIEISFKHGNIYQFGSSNTPLYSVDFNGFDNDGLPFANTLSFNTSNVSPTRNGVTKGVWGNNEVTFSTSKDLKTFIMKFNTDWIKGTITMDSKSPAVTGCGGRRVSDSPFFDGLVDDGRSLTTAENLLFKKFGWRITMFAADTKVDVTITGKKVAFRGDGYRDGHWAPNAMNDFMSTWYIMAATVGPYAFVSSTVRPTTGKNVVNIAHLIKDGKLLSSQCHILGERKTDISIINPSGEVADSGVIAPTTFNLTFVLPNHQKVAFQATNVAENPTFDIYHRWVAAYTGGSVGGSTYKGLGFVEWINAGNLSHWVDLHKQ